jgi:hypothetical protein
MDTPGNLWITPWRELRIRRLGVRVPPSAPHLTRENAAEAGGRLGSPYSCPHSCRDDGRHDGRDPRALRRMGCASRTRDRRRLDLRPRLPASDLHPRQPAIAPLRAAPRSSRGAGRRVAPVPPMLWPPRWSKPARSSRPRPVSGTGTPPPRCATTPTPHHSTTSTSRRPRPAPQRGGRVNRAPRRRAVGGRSRSREAALVSRRPSAVPPSRR